MFKVKKERLILYEQKKILDRSFRSQIRHPSSEALKLTATLPKIGKYGLEIVLIVQIVAL